MSKARARDRTDYELIGQCIAEHVADATAPLLAEIKLLKIRIGELEADRKAKSARAKGAVKCW